jgi:hypothetical protein
MENRHLSVKEFKDLGHNLIDLRDDIVTRCFTLPYLNRQFAQEDLDYLKNNEAINKMFSMLSDFARGGRYIYLDAISDPTNVGDAPEMLWEELGKSLVEPDWGSLLKDDNLEKWDEEINRNCIIHLERLFRALSRLFVWGVLGSKGKVYQAKLREFWAMDDSELGTVKYQAVT